MSPTRRDLVGYSTMNLGIVVDAVDRVKQLYHFDNSDSVSKSNSVVVDEIQLDTIR